MNLRIGSRASKLAVVQAEWIGAQLKQKHAGLEIEYRSMTTAGDRDQNAALQASGGKGLFVKELEEALLANEIDVAVHSLKDVPQALPDGLVLGPFPKREDARDAVITRFGELLNELPRGSIVGTSSPRRRAQVLHRYAKRQYHLEPLRGNVDTRLKKLHEGKYDAIILAVAGLKRLGLEKDITDVLEADDFIPAPAQGCLGLEVRSADQSIMTLLHSIEDPEAASTAAAERAFLQGLGGNCTLPVGATARLTAKDIHMKAILLNAGGTKAVEVEERGPREQSALVGYQLAERLLHDGGSELMQ